MNDPAALLQHTETLLAQGPSDAALALLGEAVQRFPDHAALVCRHADALHLAGALGPAADGYRRALILDQGLLDATAFEGGRAVLTLRGRLLADAVVRALT